MFPHRAAHLLDESGTRESTGFGEKTYSLPFYDETVPDWMFFHPRKHPDTSTPTVAAAISECREAGIHKQRLASELPDQPLNALRYAIVEVVARREELKPAPAPARMADNRQRVECSVG